MRRKYKGVKGEFNINIFGFNITRQKAVSSERGDLQRQSQAQGPYTSLFKDFVPRKVMPSLYEALRESIPILDAAIHRIISLDGIISVKGDNEMVTNEIVEWMDNVRVNDMQTGLQSFVDNISNETYEQGFAIAEFISNKERNDIIRLNVADSKDIRFRRTKSGMETWYKGWSNPSKTGQSANDKVTDILRNNIDSEQISTLTANGWMKLTGENILYTSIGNENSDPYGVSIMRGLEFVSKILLTIQNSTLNNWERFGDPSYFITYKAGKKDLGNDTLGSRQEAIAKDFNKAIADKRIGKSSDFVMATDVNSEISIQIIGHDNQTLEIETPARHVLEQIIAKVHLSGWMLGLQWSTTERLAKYEVEIVLQEATIRAKNKLPLLTGIVETMLKMKGIKWKKGDWELYFDQPNLHDEVGKAQARFLNAQADYYDNEYGSGQNPKPDTEKKSLKITGSKESRPFPNSKLDKIQFEYENELKTRWNELYEKIMAILGMQQMKSADTVNEIQEGMVLNELLVWIAAWEIMTDPAQSLRKYYGESYSLGLIQAAQLNGERIPVLNIVQNSKIYDKLVSDGFKLIKKNATQIVRDKVITEMQLQVLTGTNPQQVALKLSKIFKNANSNWERLARSEMTMAVELAKVAELKAEKVQRIHFYAAFDACPICIPLEGDYDVASVPIPVLDTHPNCYCTLGPIKEIRA